MAAEQLLNDTIASLRS